MWTRTFNNSVGVSGRRLAGKKSGGLIGNKLVSMLRGKFKRSHASTTSTPETITTLIEILFVPLRVVFQTIASIFLPRWKERLALSIPYLFSPR